jgi:3-hydroxybutyryl-CoA dehydrogenase
VAIKKVGVLGCGLMGSGIAQVSAQSGHDTIVMEASADLLERGLGRIRAFLQGGVERGKIAAADRDATLSRLKGTTDLQTLAGCDLIIEAVTEDLAVKRDMFGRLDVICGKEAIFASNTSSLSISEIMSATKRHDRFLGLHFFNPVPLMKLVEVVRTLTSAPAVVDDACRFVEKLGKVPIRTKDRTGFIVNRLLVPYILDAITVVDSGLASIQDVDTGMKLGCGYPMGPLTLLDFVGLDTTLYIADIMFEEFREPRFAPPPLLKRMVRSGYFGKKSGKGFYDWSTEPPRPNDYLVGPGAVEGAR